LNKHPSKKFIAVQQGASKFQKGVAVETRRKEPTSISLVRFI